MEQQPQLNPEEIQKEISEAVGKKTNLPDTTARLEEKRLFGDAARSERFKNCQHVIQIAGTVILGTVIIVVIAARILYLILPEKYQWMTADQVRNFDQFMFTGVMGGVIAHIGQRTGFMSKKDH